MEIVIKCENRNCADHNRVLNVVTLPNLQSVDLFMESYGHGGEDQEDYCPNCKDLGVTELKKVS